MADTSRVAVITGGAGGLGIAIAARLSRDATVVLVDLDEARVEAAIRGPLVECDGITGIACDVSDSESVGQMVSSIVDDLGRIDVLVNAAGIAGLTPLLETTPEAWERTLAVNLNGTFYCAQAVGRVMAGQGGGHIVNIASTSGVRAGFARAAYGTSKAGVIHLTRQLALELAPMGVSVNAVGPGPVATELALSTHTPEMREDYHATIPQARYATPEEVANAVAFLASPTTGYINGETLFVDGGFLASGVDVRSAQARGNLI